MAEPTNPYEAFDVDHWKKAMVEEYEALVKNNTWKLVPYKGKHMIDCKWIFKVKLAADGYVERY